MTDDPDRIKVTDRRHFDPSGERRPGDEGRETETHPEAHPAPGPEPARSPDDAPAPPSGPGPTPSGQEKSGAADGSRSPGQGQPPSADPGAAPEDLSALAAGLSSSFSLLIARLAQETEIYLGLVPYPGKETPEPDLDAARAMIDVLSMLQEKTRGNLDFEESRLLDNLLYTYRLEFVRRRSGGEAR